MTTQSLGAILNMIQNPFLYSENEAQQNKLINDLQAICRMESEAEKAKVNKFNIWKYVSNDSGRPQFCGVHHEGGWRVASNAHILVALKEEYDGSLEGRTIGRDGKAIDTGKYPNWQSIFPTVEPDATCKIDMDAMPDLFKRIKLDAKMGVGVQVIELDYTNKAGGPVRVQFTPKCFELMVDAMRYTGADEVRVYGSRRWVDFSGTNGKGILMPRYSFLEKDEEGIGRIYHV